jgi:hypothetical protein
MMTWALAHFKLDMPEVFAAAAQLVRFSQRIRHQSSCGVYIKNVVAGITVVLQVSQGLSPAAAGVLMTWALTNLKEDMPEVFAAAAQQMGLTRLP